MEVAAAHEAKLALSEDLLVAAGSMASALGTGLLHRTIHASLRGRSANIAARLWGGRGDIAPESSPYHLMALEPKQN